MRRASLIVLAASTLSACTTLGEIPTARLASAALRQANGAPAGTAVIARAGDRVTINVALIGLPAGQHGMHLHMAGRCDAPDFTTAGGHLNPAARQHGHDNPAGSHLGDLPNVTITSNGTGVASAELGGTAAAIEASLFDSDGTAIVIHAAADDYRTDPAGNAGARIACGVLNRS